MKTIMSIYKTGFLFVMLNMVAYSTFSQPVTFKLLDLKNKTWCMQGMTDKTNEATYKDNKVTYIFTDASKSTYTLEFEYYLSDSVETTFNSDRIGKILEGKYIITRVFKDNKSNPEQPQPVSVFEIKELNSTKLVLRNIEQQNLLEYIAR